MTIVTERVAISFEGEIKAPVSFYYEQYYVTKCSFTNQQTTNCGKELCLS